MAETVAPFAIRVTRPYPSEDELLENELDTFTRTSITLLGAQPRPPGLVLRFELLLSSGQVLVRGEGRVVGYRRDAYYGLGGLTLRFTRLDTRSKAFVDKAAATRERRRPSSKISSIEAPSSPSLPVHLDDVLEMSVPPPPPSVAPRAEPPSGVSPPAVAASRSVPPPPLEIAFPPPQVETLLASSEAPSPRAPAPAFSADSIPPDRDALLARLRERSGALSPEAVREILERGR